MAKRFDIHEWQAQQQMKQWLREADDFTPDLEDDDLKRSKVQQMMAKEKPKTPQNVERGTLNNTIADLAEIYSYGEILDSLKVFYTDNGEQPYADMAKKHAKEFRDFLGPDEGDETHIVVGAKKDEEGMDSEPLQYGDEYMSFQEAHDAAVKGGFLVEKEQKNPILSILGHHPFAMMLSSLRNK